MERYVRTLGQAPELRLQSSIELDGVDMGATRREHLCQSPKAGTDFERDIAVVELRKAGYHTEDVVVRKEVLTERLLWRRAAHAGGIPKATVAFASICAASADISSPRTPARTASVCTTLAGSLRFPRSV